MHPNAQRVQDALAAAGSGAQVVELTDSARTAAEAAAALGCPVGAIVKSLVFAADGSPVLVLTSGDHQVDPARVAALLGAARVARADPGLVRDATGFPIGGVSPLGHPRVLPVLVDQTLARYDVLWAAAGTPHTVFPTSYAELLRLCAGRAAEVAAG